jgi:phosphoribosyl 1,2-cyclic phosphate phosphodiesterase
MQASLTFLGTGTSMGVPTLGCGCAVCTSSDPHDTRLRPSILVRWDCPEGVSLPVAKVRTPKDQLPFPPLPSPDPCERIVLIDTGPDFRAQAMSAGLRRIDAVFYTHSHADHILGLDDLRPLSFNTFRASGPIPLYATEETRAVLEHIFTYTFSPDSKYPNRAKVALHTIQPVSPIQVHELAFTPIPVLHGTLPITGYRFGDVAYLTDVSTIPEASFRLLEGLDTLIVSALRHTPHPSHATVDQAVRWANRIGAGQTFFTHISHELGHQATNANLPDGMALAHDGLTIPMTIPTIVPEAAV